MQARSRFPDTADSLPNPVHKCDFVHGLSRSRSTLGEEDMDRVEACTEDRHSIGNGSEERIGQQDRSPCSIAR